MKKIVITGARSGIAGAVIERLKKKDYFIYVGVHNEKQLEQVKKWYQNDSNIECLKLDVTDPKDREHFRTLDFDILINNAAIGKGGSLAEIPMDHVRENFETNVFSSFELVQLALQKMIPRNEGKIIMMGSLAGIFPLAFLGSYCGSKAAINKMTTVLRREVNLVAPNVQIHLIEPGLYATGFNQVMYDDKYSWMREKSYFEREIQFLQTKESLLLELCEKKSLHSIVRQIEKAVETNRCKLLYRAPLSQVVSAKLYELFLQ